MARYTFFNPSYPNCKKRDDSVEKIKNASENFSNHYLTYLIDIKYGFKCYFVIQHKIQHTIYAFFTHT